LTKTSFLSSLLTKLANQPAVGLVPRESAAVAVIFRDTKSGEEVLLIKRADKAGDPWSGQMAFPGGRVSEEDTSFKETAEREALEEVGIDLATKGEFVGYLPELRPHLRDVIVVPCVFKLGSQAAVSMNSEVAAFDWVPLGELAKPKARSTFRMRRGGGEVSFPSLVWKGRVIWGMTERALTSLIG
jgi:8-oxo-dGTP pyrophosphatase MutT (NUDIX family)